MIASVDIALVQLGPGAVVVPSAEYDAIMAQTDVDLSDPRNRCVLHALVLPAYGSGSYDWCRIEMLAREVVVACQDGMTRALTALYQRPTEVETTGLWDCKTSRYAMAVAQLLEEPGFDVAEAWPLTPRAMMYLLAWSTAFQTTMRGLLEPIYVGKLDGVMPVVPAKGETGRFVEARAPGDCIPSHPHVDDEPRARVGSGAFQTAGYGDADKPAKDESRGSILLPVAIGLGLFGLGTVAWQYVK